jgi:Zn finger protein HypA/HybF involved in hydrogenase expression
VHELSLALEVCRIAELHLDPARAARVRRLGVEVGRDANIEVENFRFCLEALLEAPPFSGATPCIIPCPGPDLRLAYLEVDDDGPDD